MGNTKGLRMTGIWIVFVVLFFAFKLADAGNIDGYDNKGNYYHGWVDSGRNVDVYDSHGNLRTGRVDRNGNITIDDGRGDYSNSPDGKSWDSMRVPKREEERE